MNLRKPHPAQKTIDSLSARLLKPCRYCGGPRRYDEDQKLALCPKRECIQKAGNEASIALYGVPLGRPHQE